MKEFLRYQFVFSTVVLFGVSDSDKSKVFLWVSFMVFAYFTIWTLFGRERNTP